MNKKAFGLVEVMIALIVALVIAIGIMSYQYAAAINVRNAENRATANRLALLISNSLAVDRFHFYPIDLDQYDISDPLHGAGIGLEPMQYFSELGTIEALSGIPITGSPTPLRHYRLFMNGAWFWIKLTYEDTWPDGGAGVINPMRKLSVIVAWSDNVTSDSILNYNPLRCIITTKFVKTITPDFNPVPG